MLTSNISPPGRTPDSRRKESIHTRAHTSRLFTKRAEDVERKKRDCLLDTVDSLRGGPSTPKPVNGTGNESNRKGDGSDPKVLTCTSPKRPFSDRRCLWCAFRHSVFEFCDDPVKMCHGWRWRVCARARVCAFYFRLCTCACGGVTRQSPQQSSPKVTEQREEVGRGHSQPLSLIMWASSMMNLPSLYFWLLSNACSCNRDKNRQILPPIFIFFYKHTKQCCTEED